MDQFYPVTYASTQTQDVFGNSGADDGDTWYNVPTDSSAHDDAEAIASFAVSPLQLEYAVDRHNKTEFTTGAVIKTQFYTR